jgi:hypothetical protein
VKRIEHRLQVPIGEPRLVEQSWLAHEQLRESGEDLLSGFDDSVGKSHVSALVA